MRLKHKATNGRVAVMESVRLCKPETVIGWHRAMVRRKWTFKQGRKRGRPPLDSELKYLIRDHDTKFTHSFDTVFEAADIEIVNIPYQAPNANAVAERWVRSVRQECLDRLIILNERHLRRVLVGYYNGRRPHQGLEQDSPLGLDSVSTEGPIRCRSVLGGIIRDYYREAA
jgi:hypothetical protein